MLCYSVNGGDNVLIDSKKLEELLGVSRTTLYKLRKKGLPFKNVGSQIRYDHAEVLEWINEQKK